MRSTQPIGNVRHFHSHTRELLPHLTPFHDADAKWFTKPGSYVGSDFAGEVVQVGPNLRTGIKVGDKVASSVRGGVSRERGAFSEYAKTFADLAFAIPEGTWSFEEASTIGIPFVLFISSPVQSKVTDYPPV